MKAMLFPVVMYGCEIWTVISSKRSEIKCWGGYGEKRTLDAVGGKVEWYSQYAKQYEGSSKY